MEEQYHNHIYKFRYTTLFIRRAPAIVSAQDVERGKSILEEKLKKIHKTTKDIGFKVDNIKDTGNKSDNEWVTIPGYDL